VGDTGGRVNGKGKGGEIRYKYSICLHKNRIINLVEITLDVKKNDGREGMMEGTL
jgi:hypothetical protein